MTKEGSSITAYAIIIAIGMGQTEFCRNLVALNEKGDIIIGPDCPTDVDGIFACGDVGGEEGAKASLSSKKYLQDMGIK